MTTGRINQVTILSPCAEASGQTPRRERVLPKQGDAEATPVAALIMSKTRSAPATDSIAPTEFPKVWSATRHAQILLSRTVPAAYTPQEEKTYALSHAIARKLSKAVPEDLGSCLAKPSIHRPHMVPDEKYQRGFSCQSRRRSNT